LTFHSLKNISSQTFQGFPVVYSFLHFRCDAAVSVWTSPTASGIFRSPKRLSRGPFICRGARRDHPLPFLAPHRRRLTGVAPLHLFTNQLQLSYTNIMGPDQRHPSFKPGGRCTRGQKIRVSSSNQHAMAPRSLPIATVLQRFFHELFSNS